MTDRPTTAPGALRAWEPWYFVPRSQVWEGSRGGQSGNVHLRRSYRSRIGQAVALYPLTGPARPLVRQIGQALCGKDDPWYPRPAHPYENDSQRCPRCAAAADRYGIDWPDPIPDDVARTL